MVNSSLKLGEFNLEFSHQERFRLFSFEDIFSNESYEILLKGLSKLNWKEEVTDFYSQYSASISSTDDNPFALLLQGEFFFSFKAKLEAVLGVTLRNAALIVAHKLVMSQEIGVHNDYCDPELGYENFRFIFQLSKTDEITPGGELTFLHSEDKRAVIKTYPYAMNKGICFEITPHSHHYVAPVQNERYTVVMYLWEQSSKYDGSGTEII